MNYETSIRITAFVSALFIIPLYCAIANFYFTKMFTGYALCALYYLSMGLIWLNCRQKRQKWDTGTSALIFFLIVYSSLAFIGQASAITYSLVFLLPLIVIAYLINESNTKIFGAYIQKLFVISIAITTALTISVLIKYPEAARVLASNSFVKYGKTYYKSLGTGGFDFIYSSLLIVPALFLMAKKSKRWAKTFYFALSIAMFAVVLMSGYTTAIILLLLEVVLYSISKLRKQKIAVITLIFLLFALLRLFSHDISNYIISIANNFKSEFVQNHLKEIAEILSGKNDITNLNRFALFQQSVNSFARSPILGAYVSGANAEISGHSTLLDILGGGGIVCFVPYCVFLASFYKKIKYQLTNSTIKYVWNIITFIYIFLQLLNPVLTNYQIVFSYMAIIPIILAFCDKEATAVGNSVN